MTSNALTWLIAIPLAASPINYLVGRLSGKRLGSQTANPARWIALLFLLGAWVPFALAVQAVQAEGSINASFGAINLRLDGISLVLSGVALLLGGVVTWFSGRYLAGEEAQEKYYALLSIMTGAMIGLSTAGDLFNLWVWFETMAISSYMLVAFHRQVPAALEAGVKYLVQSTAGSILVLLGIALVLGQTGTLDLLQIQSITINAPQLMAAGALFLIGFGVKTALVPLHTWLPDAHSQAPSGISAMLSGVVIEAGLVAMLRSLGALSGVTHLWGPLLLGFAAVNMLVGNLMALRQTQVKRLLAYSSLAHMGYMLLGFGITITFGQANGAQGAFFHLINHGMMKGLAFLSAGALLYTLRISRGNHQPLTLNDLCGASRRYPLAAFTLSIAVLGLGGLPPLSGFMSKWQIFVAGFQTQNPAIIGLVVFAALNSVLSLAYYAPIVNRLYRRSPSDLVAQGSSLSVSMTIPLILLAVGVVILGIWPTLVDGCTVPAANAFLSAFGG